jgi:lipopolysaccharide/colanic/teichoic acid biosynthesis glycosyltransferase
MINRMGGALVLALTSPVLGLITLAVRLLDGHPVFFNQERAGQHGRPFRVLKFRTMRPPDSPDEPDEARITSTGRLLRASSLDELPSLWNVVRGEMNLVGPRPLPIAYNALYSPSQARRLEVKPGVTGLLQVRGRNALSWTEKFAIDTWYVDHRSWWLDLRILLETPLVVVRGTGISHPGHATMPVFDGSAASSPDAD